MAFLRGRLALLLAAAAAACTPDARSPGYGGAYGSGPVGDDSLRAPPSASGSPAVYADVSRCFVDAPRHAWVKLRVHLTAEGKVQKVEDEGSTAEVAAIECSMRAVSQGGFPPCSACGHYEHHVEFEVEPVAPAAPPPPTDIDAFDGGLLPPPPPVAAPPPPLGAPGMAEPDGGSEHWM
jgi:hypothetical protein